MADTETRTRISQVGTVFVPAAGQDRALEFYLDKLGFEKRADFREGEEERERTIVAARKLRKKSVPIVGTTE